MSPLCRHPWAMWASPSITRLRPIRCPHRWSRWPRVSTLQGGTPSCGPELWTALRPIRRSCSFGRPPPLRLFDPGRDAGRLAFSRIGDAGRRGLFRVPFSEVTGRPVFHFELPVDPRGAGLADYTASLVIKDRIKARQETIGEADALRVRLRGL